MDGLSIGSILASVVATILVMSALFYWPWIRAYLQLGKRTPSRLVGTWHGYADEVRLIRGTRFPSIGASTDLVEDLTRLTRFRVTLSTREARRVARGTISLVPSTSESGSFTRPLTVPVSAFSTEFGYIVIMQGPMLGQASYTGAGILRPHASGGWHGFLIAEQFHGRDLVLVQFDLSPQWGTEDVTAHD